MKTVWVNSRGEKLDFDQHKFIEEIYKDQHVSLVFMKPSQIGFSERLISEAVWVCDRLGKTVLYAFPTSSQLSDFVQARLEPVFAYSDYLSRITDAMTAQEKRDLDIEDKAKVGKVGLKQIRKGFLYLRGSQNEQQIISVDADLVVLDERDRFMQEHVPFIDKRLLHSTLKWRREASTPTLPGFGIHDSYLNSDQRIWVLKCTMCGLEQELDFFDNVDFDRKIVVCKKCKDPLDRLKKGRWVVQNQENKETHGYRVSGLLNPRKAIPDFITDYEKAKNSGYAAMQQFYNQTLGVPYEAVGQKVLRTDLDACRGNYEMPYPVEGAIMGADVGEVVHAVVSTMFNRKIRYAWIGTVQNFMGATDSVEWLMNKFKIKYLVIDAKPDTRKVNELMNKFMGRVFAAYYPTRKFDVQEYYVYDDDKYEVSIDRTISLDFLVNDIQNEVIELPRNAEYVPEFYNQMRAAVRMAQTNMRSGQIEYKWIEKSADHFFHAANYNRISMLKTLSGQGILDQFKQFNNVEVAPNGLPTSLADLTRWVRLNGEKIF